MTNGVTIDTECVLLAGNNANGVYPLKYFRGKFDAYQRTYVIRTLDDKRLINRYLYYALEPQLDHLKSISTGAATKFLTLGILNEIRLDLPPLATQRKIAAILSAYDDLIENNTRRIQILEDMARSLYREWFVHFRFLGHANVPLVESALGPIPEGWSWVSLTKLGRVVTGKTPDKSCPEYFGDWMPFIKTPDFHGSLFCTQTNEGLSESGAFSQKNKTVPPDSLCVTCIGTAGLVTITTCDSQTNQQINSLVLSNLKYREFLYFALLGLQDKIKLYGANGATMVNLSKSKFEALQVLAPHTFLVNRYHVSVQPMFDAIKNLSIKNANLRKTRDLLLPRLISGELDVSGLTIATTESAE